MITLTVDSEALARGLANAGAFVPANSRMPHVWLHTKPPGEILEIVGTDSYAAGLATVPVERREGPQGELDRLLDRGRADTRRAEGAAGVERVVRLAGRGTTRLIIGAGSVQADPMGGTPLTVPTVDAPGQREPYRHLVALVDAAERRPEAIPGVLCVDPALLARFAKVRADKGRMADLLFGAQPLDPVLVKIGTHFKGLVMPIDRDVQAANIGPEGLW